MENIIGISALFHDSACTLLQDGKIVAAIQEERYTRIKNDPSLPINSFRKCMELGNINISDIDVVSYYEDPNLKLERQLKYGTDLSEARKKGKLDPNRITKQIRELLGYEGKIEFHTHHMSHAASSFFTSGLNEAAILINDGVGEWATTSYGYGNGDKISILKQIDFPNSVGLFYSTVTNYLGFRVNSGEYKVMGLAPYGESKYVSQLEHLINYRGEGEYELEPKYYDFINGTRMFSPSLEKLLGRPPREPEAEITQFHMDVARSLQEVLNSIVLKQAEYLHELTGSDNLCLAGGVALNCVSNRYIEENSKFKEVYIQPASGDAGGALGAALLSSKKKNNVAFENIYLGEEYSLEEIESIVEATGFAYRKDNDDEALCFDVAKALSEGKVIGWFQGRMEFGPRALGNRSILADPRSNEMRDKINSMVKKREGFRPFAPVVKEDVASDYFECNKSCPFMLKTYSVVSSLKLPAITHIDNSARVQTVNKKQNKLLYKLLDSFESITGCPILLNTSFNVRGEPIVESPIDAIECFVNTEIDSLVLGNILINREDNTDLIEKYRKIQEKIHVSHLSSDFDFNLYTFI